MSLRSVAPIRAKRPERGGRTLALSSLAVTTSSSISKMNLSLWTLRPGEGDIPSIPPGEAEPIDSVFWSGPVGGVPLCAVCRMGDRCNAPVGRQTGLRGASAGLPLPPYVSIGGAGGGSSKCSHGASGRGLSMLPAGDVIDPDERESERSSLGEARMSRYQDSLEPSRRLLPADRGGAGGGMSIGSGGRGASSSSSASMAGSAKLPGAAARLAPSVASPPPAAASASAATAATPPSAGAAATSASRDPRGVG
mmetsp:Transcript_38809/g.123283  ORF Transcript_38809/g.123283 Transcript_38809/m.123283 type:complete len:252 (-) Transcript_38809:1368-2123(-)